jgi:hypothetical protein
MHKLQILKQMIERNSDCNELLKECISEFSESKQNKRGLMTLILRNYINKDKIDEVKNILYNNNDLMRRDYLACLEFFLKKNKDYYYFDIEYIYNNIDDIEMKDVDLMIDNKWIDLLKKFDGYMINCSYKSNINNDDKKNLRKYQFDVKKMRDKYYQRIKNRDEMDVLMNGVDVLIDGANMSHLTGKFDFLILPTIIKKFNKQNIKAKIILHERHILSSELLEQLSDYLIRTPTMRNDDDYMIYGMMIHNIMVLTNDQFRDHLKDMDLKTKCFVKSMSIKYYNNNFIIPRYSKCIQVCDSNNTIYIPTKDNGFYKLISF